MASKEESDKANKDRVLKVLAKKCIHDHRHPLMKVCLPSQKLFFAAKNYEETALVKEYQDQFSTILDHQRVEKRSSRAQAVWLDNKGVAKVTKVVKNLLKYFGYQNKEGVFLHPEEMLYLLETNRLEVIFIGTSLSIEKAYELVLKIPNVNFIKYRVYKKLANLGYKLVRYEQIQSKGIHGIKNSKSKRALEESDNCELMVCKKLKQSVSVEDNEHKSGTSEKSTNIQEPVSLIPKEAEYILNIFDRLRENMPRDCFDEPIITNPDYLVWSPTNTSILEPNYYLFICEQNILEKRNFSSNSPNIYALCIDDVSFYKFCDVHLPYYI